MQKSLWNHRGGRTWRRASSAGVSPAVLWASCPQLVSICRTGLPLPRMAIQDVTRGYEIKTDEELLRLALDQDQLTPEAAAALASELSKRGIDGTERLNSFREEEEERKAEQDKKPRPLFFIEPWGVGFRRFGKADCILLSKTGRERFRTTVFVVLFWFPFIPTRTYLAERSSRTGKTIFMKKLPLDWEQILKVWIVAVASLLSLVLLLRELLPRLLRRA